MPLITKSSPGDSDAQLALIEANTLCALVSPHHLGEYRQNGLTGTQAVMGEADGKKVLSKNRYVA